MKDFGLFINGQWEAAKGGKTAPTINPATEEPWATVAVADREDLNKAVARIVRIKALFDVMPPLRRSRHLRQTYIRLTGWVRNTPEGDVELIAEGVKAQLHRLVTWSHAGPRGALVTDVQQQWLPYSDELDSFRIGISFKAHPRRSKPEDVVPRGVQPEDAEAVSKPDGARNTERRAHTKAEDEQR